MRRIFLNCIFAIVEFVSELAILVFIGIGCLLTFTGRENLNQNTSTLIQLIAIFLILFSTLTNLVYSMFVIIKGILNVINLLKAKSLKNKINKKYEEYKKVNKEEDVNADAAVFQNSEIINLARIKPIVDDWDLRLSSEEDQPGPLKKGPNEPVRLTKKKSTKRKRFKKARNFDNIEPCENEIQGENTG